jgi:hypothetical protein
MSPLFDIHFVERLRVAHRIDTAGLFHIAGG